MRELPVACTLSGAEQAQRAGEWRALMGDAVLERTVMREGAFVRVAPAAEAELRRLIAAESECCAFLDFDLRADGDELRLKVTGPDEARPIILALVGLAPDAP